jgi:hypothetical protein
LVNSSFYDCNNFNFNLKKMKREKREKIEGDFYWYKEENKDLDFSSLKTIGGYAYLRGCSADLSSLEKIGNLANLEGCSSDLSSLKSIGGNAYLRGCSSDLSSLKTISGYAYIQGCPEKLKKSLAKTLKECGDIYIEFRDLPLTLEEFKKMYRENPKEIVINGATYILKD